MIHQYINTILKRINLEYKYFTCKNWTLKEVGEFWDTVSDYDDINENTYTYFRRFIDGYDLCTIPDNSYVMDICSRTGNGSVYFWERGKIKKTICVDVSLEFQNICAYNLKKRGLNFETQIFHKFPLPFPDNEFEAILSFETIEHIGQPEVFVKELYRVLQPGGELLLTCPNILWEPIHWIAAILGIHHSEGPHNFLSRSYLHNCIIEAGFKIGKEKTTILIPGGPKTLISFSKMVEEKYTKTIMPMFGLRRILVCYKN